jgi:hypothetical protein
MSSGKQKKTTPQEQLEMQEQPKEQEQTESKEQPKLKAQIYCGPQLPQGLLNSYTVYQNELPKHLEGHFEKCPAIKRLFVPVEKFTTVQQAIQTPGTAESVWYGQVLEYIKGGDK